VLIQSVFVDNVGGSRHIADAFRTTGNGQLVEREVVLCGASSGFLSHNGGTAKN